MQTHYRGLDAQGFIDNVYSPDHIQCEFKPVVAHVVSQLIQRLPEQIDGIYLYGSVARGNAVVGRSDLDVSIVMATPLTPQHQLVFEELSMTIPHSYPEVSKLDIDPGYREEVLRPQEVYHWQFWLKHCCCCIWGNDLSQGFAPYQPSIEIARALNGDLLRFAEQMQADFIHMSEPSVAKIIGKKLLRSAYYFVAADDGSWYTSLAQCVEVAKQYYPECRDDIELAYRYAIGEVSSQVGALDLYHRLSGQIMAMAE